MPSATSGDFVVLDVAEGLGDVAQADQGAVLPGNDQRHVAGGAFDVGPVAAGVTELRSEVRSTDAGVVLALGQPVTRDRRR